MEKDKDGKIASKAKRYLDTKLPRFPVDKKAIKMNIRGFNQSIFKKEKAERTWLKCIEKYPRFEWPYSNLGSMYTEQGKLDKAESLLNKAIEINPNYYNAWLHLSKLKEKQNDQAGYKRCMEKLVELDPNRAPSKAYMLKKSVGF